MSVEKAIEHARAGLEHDLEEFFEELRIPSVSTLPEHAADCRRNAGWLRERLDRLGFETQLIPVDVPGAKHPVLRADWNGRPGAPHLTIYGHYDVQPPDPLEEWRTPPFEPTVIDGFVHARGCSDNKNNHLAALKAVEHWFAAGGPPLNLRFLIEGEEEISGPSLPAYVRANGADLATDAALIWDGGFAPDGKPALVNVLRGIVYAEITATGAAVDLHSGGFGGIAPNPLNTLARILGELKDRDGHVTVPGFYDGIIPPAAAEVAGWPSGPAFEAELRALAGTDVFEGEPGYSPQERMWARPTLDVNGMVGGFTGEGAKTVISNHASAKVSMRLVPGQDAHRIADTFAEYVSSLTTPGVRVEVKFHGIAPPTVAGTDHAAARALAEAFEDGFGVRAQPVRTGGSIPVAIDFDEAIGCPLVISGLSQPGAGAHSPREHFDLSHFGRGIETLIHFIDRLAKTS